MAGRHTEQETGVMAEARGDEMVLLLLSSGWQLHAIGSIRHGRRDAAACRRQNFRAGIRPRCPDSVASFFFSSPFSDSKVV